MLLSKENYNKLNENYLYKREPIIRGNWIGYDVYHCKNWTFRVRKFENGTAYMVDTYFNSLDSHYIEITNENINDFEIVFNFNDVKRIRDGEENEYNKEELFHVATDSGGYSCGNLYWVKRDAKKSKQLMINKKKKEIESLKRKLEWAEDDLKRIMTEK